MAAAAFRWWPARVLIIEDDADIAELYRLKLSLAGFDVTVAADGQAGLDSARRCEPDVVLLDIRLPKLTGIEVLAALHSREVGRRCPPVVVVSNMDDPVLRQEALALGAKEYLVKSRTTPRQLADTVARWLAPQDGSS